MRTAEDVSNLLKSLELSNELYVEDLDFIFLLYRSCNPGLEQKMLNFGLLVGHGSAVRYKDKGIVIVGGSMVGKSTLAGNLCKGEAYKMLADDQLLAFDPDNKENMRVYPLPEHSERVYFLD